MGVVPGGMESPPRRGAEGRHGAGEQPSGSKRSLKLCPGGRVLSVCGWEAAARVSVGTWQSLHLAGSVLRKRSHTHRKFREDTVYCRNRSNQEDELPDSGRSKKQTAVQRPQGTGELLPPRTAWHAEP